MSQIQSRLYQTEAVAAIVDAHARGCTSSVALPTGTGKTVQKATGAQGRVEGMVTLCESHETGWSHSARSNHMMQEKMHGAIGSWKRLERG